MDSQGSGPPWVAVTSDQVAGLLAAYRQAQVGAERIRRGLTGRDEGAQMPTVTASVDADGEPMVCIDLPGDREGPEGRGTEAVA